ncbi:hypothetical protein NE237_011218 [Protea cynaroides]|uniref:Uncharacterized protein n=1 Tax=Protea cynaroides TaxID=273540 RepID=A0A9Q0GVQ4_9MAGN|nr:hypothetical protein NE237_011218 [Protea cynaroides]
MNDDRRRKKRVKRMDRSGTRSLRRRSSTISQRLRLTDHNVGCLDSLSNANLMEEVCEALARNIGEDKAEVEELKRESAKVREEVEKEREMLQLADVLCEERVQMKLSEAKFQFEEKNAAVDKLRNELWTAVDKLAKRGS